MKTGCWSFALAVVCVACSTQATVDQRLTVEDIEAIRELNRAYPAATPLSTVPVFEMSPEEIDGTGDIAYVRGTMSLSFSVEEEGATRLYSTAGDYLMVTRRDDGDQWKIARYIWNHPPWEPS